MAAFSFKKEIKQIQSFPEVCVYSCSKQGEIRTFELTRQYYLVTIFKWSFKVLESLQVECTNCKWSATIPTNFARKAFKKGLNSHLLLRYGNSKLISSRILNTWGSLWRIWLITLGVLLVITIATINANSIQYSEPKQINFQDLFNGSNVGEIVRLEGKADYTLALTKDITYENNPGSVIERQLYMPIFPTTGSSDFAVIKGGKDDLNKVLARQSVKNEDLLKNQDYTITGRVETIDSIENTELAKYFTEQLPLRKNFNKPQVVINSYDVKTLGNLLSDFLLFYIAAILALCSSIYVQIYIDKYIALKRV